MEFMKFTRAKIKKHDAMPDGKNNPFEVFYKRL
jgi:hypothetical protein